MICCLGGLHSLKCCRDRSDGFWSCSVRKDKCSWLYLSSVDSSLLPQCLWPCQAGVIWATPTLWYWKIILPKTGGWGTRTPKISYLEDHSFPCPYLYPASYVLKRDKEPIQEKSLHLGVFTQSSWLGVQTCCQQLFHFTARAEHFQTAKQNYQYNKLHRSTFISSEEKETD